MQLDNFSKGLVTRVDPHLVDLQSAIAFHNIDNSGGSIKSLQGHTQRQPIGANLSFSRFGRTGAVDSDDSDRIIEYPFESEAIEHNNSLYITKGSEDRDYPVAVDRKDTENIKRRLGIVPPELKSNQEDPNEDSFNVVHEGGDRIYNYPVLKVTSTYFSDAETIPNILPDNIITQLNFRLVVNVGGILVESRDQTIIEDSSVGTTRTFGGIFGGTLPRRNYILEFDDSNEDNFIPDDMTGYTYDVYIQIGTTYRFLARAIGTEFRFTLPIITSISQGSAIKSASFIGSEVYNDDIIVSTPQDIGNEISYAFTYYNEIRDIESRPALLDETFSTTARSIIDFTQTPVSRDPQVTHTRIYRLGRSSIETSFSLVAQLESPTDRNMPGLGFRDQLDPSNIDSIIQEQHDYHEAPNMVHFEVTSYGIMFGMLAPNDDDSNATSRLRFSLQGQYDYWPPENTINLFKPITGILEVSQGLLIFTENETHILSGNSRESFQLQLVSLDQGCISRAKRGYRSCKYIKSHPIWISNDGICKLINGRVEVISRLYLKRGEYFNTRTLINCAVHDDIYYVLYEANLSGTEKAMISMDERFGMSWVTHTANNLKDIKVFEDRRWGIREDQIISMFDGNSQIINYRSPKLTSGSISLQKEFNYVYIRYRGQFKCKVIVGDSMDFDIPGKFIETTLNSNEETTQIIDIPVKLKKGYFIQFDFVSMNQGVNEIMEIEYKIVQRKKDIRDE